MMDIYAGWLHNLKTYGITVIKLNTEDVCVTGYSLVTAVTMSSAMSLAKTSYSSERGRCFGGKHRFHYQVLRGS
jgi:hypothetical protein